ncbi:sulfite exporter TauE/SafE family protein [Sphingopyxis yananensis]|uniref:sulfite exporter TauE/SafE family protein n=1 Tax=Sphingopyxis yananensis TaxID=2886687 RepID=UPI001D127149|nr:sulfite exporter TauE/SafE family protein [Sphingopyxis yananensis]MCC2602103.1 sulfite exporter TauE/SafE family protein [Sphingopyxis yananensis]
MMIAAGLNEFSPLTVAAAAAMTFGAAYVRGLTGFGMAIILVPLLGLLVPPEEAVVLGILLQLLIGPVGLRHTVATADKASAIPIGVTAMALTPLGMWVLAQTPTDVARLLITASAVAAFVAVLLPKKAAGHAPSRWAVLGTGAASGILTGFAAMPGPPVVPFYLRRNVDPVVARASMLTIFFLTAISGTLAALWLGIVTPRLFVLALMLFVPMWLGNKLGARHFGRVAPPVWQAMVAVVLGVAAVSAVVRAL